MFLHLCTSSPLQNSNDGSHANNIFDSLPIKVDWSNLCDLGSNVGTIDDVAFSARAAPADTVPIANVMAIKVVPIGTLSDDEEEASFVTLAAASFAIVVEVPELLGAPTLDLQRYEIGGGAPVRIEIPLLLHLPAILEQKRAVAMRMLIPIAGA